MTTERLIKSPRKLIEVALPLDAINAAAKREGFIYRGNPSAIHKWWAQRPLAAARAVLFAQLVNDPEDYWRLQNEGKAPNQQVRGNWTRARARLFKIIEKLVVWENLNNLDVLKEARECILESWRQTCQLNAGNPKDNTVFKENAPLTLWDPFAGGGSIPLEAQRLGLKAIATDLNPVAVIINKALIDIPPRFYGTSAVNASAKDQIRTWSQTEGLSDDIVYYGAEVKKRTAALIGALYPKILVTKDLTKNRPDLVGLVGQKLQVITWLWCRTVRSPSPAFNSVQVPLAGSFAVSTKATRPVFVDPVLNKNGYSFQIKLGVPPADSAKGTSFGKQKGFKCLMSGVPIGYDYIRKEAIAGRMGQRLMAIVADGPNGRVYISPTEEHEKIALSARPTWAPELDLPEQALGFRVQLYGMKKYRDIYTERQLCALTSISDIINEVQGSIQADAVAAGLPNDNVSLKKGGRGAKAYAESVCVYLAFAMDKMAEYGCTIVPWYAKEDRPKGLFARQAIPMVWDFAEVNPLCDIGGSYEASIKIVSGGLIGCSSQASSGVVLQAAAQGTSHPPVTNCVISTDPPYYDNIGYADLSDFFYVWMRRTLRGIFPDELATTATPKNEELVASPFRHKSKDSAELFFLSGMTAVMRRLSDCSHPAYPLTIYYAFKQSETDSEETSSTGWETFLQAVVDSGLSISGTWPMRTERAERSVGQGTNSLASSIILVCRPRASDASSISRREFVRLLNQELPLALDAMTRKDEGLHSPVAPVDLSQAIIGPGMAIFTRFSAVLDADGGHMRVQTALQLINRFLAEDDFDHDTQFCLAWFQQYGWTEGKFGEADVLARSKGTSVDGCKQAGVVESGHGIVRILKPTEYPSVWNPKTDRRLPVWEALHQMIRAFRSGGESEAGRILAAVTGKAEAIRQLAYRLYTLCERSGWAEDARAYNELVTSWAPIEAASMTIIDANAPKQTTLFDK
jgi:putative DNA methylase